MIRKIIIGAVSLTLATACYSPKNDAESATVKLETQKQKLSYAVGADHGHSISESGDPHYSKYNLDAITKGFQIGLNDEKAFGKDCQNTLISLYGKDGGEFNEKFLDAGCECLGKLSGVVFRNSWVKKGGLDYMDTKYIIAGFNDALHKSDSIIKKEDQVALVKNFYEDLNKKNGEKMIQKALSQPNTQRVDGVVIETIKEGTGKAPTATDKVQSQYILINSSGDTLQSSFAYTQYTGKSMEPFALDQVIKGWQVGMTHMKEGGKYMLYVPYNLAYGEQGMFNPQRNAYDIQPFETLKFYIELEKVVK